MSEELSPELIQELLRFLIFIGISTIIVWALYANTIRNTLKLISVENQCILPNQAWFLLIPFFNVYWNFEMAKRLSNSLNNEFFDRKIEVEENPGLKAGLTYAWSFLVFYFPFPSYIRLIAMLVCMIYFILYWYKINQYRLLIIEHNKWLEEYNK